MITVKNSGMLVRATISDDVLAEMGRARQLLVSLPSAKSMTLQGGDCEYWSYEKDKDCIVEHTLEGRTALELQKKLVSRVVSDVRASVSDVEDTYNKIKNRSPGHIDSEIADQCAAILLTVARSLRKVAALLGRPENIKKVLAALNKLSAVDTQLVQEHLCVDGRIIGGYYYHPASTTKLLHSKLTHVLDVCDRFKRGELPESHSEPMEIIVHADGLTEISWGLDDEYKPYSLDVTNQLPQPVSPVIVYALTGQLPASSHELAEPASDLYRNLAVSAPQVEPGATRRPVILQPDSLLTDADK